MRYEPPVQSVQNVILFGVSERGKRASGIVDVSPQRTDLDMGDTLTAQRAVRVFDAAVEGNVNGRAAARAGQFPDAEALHLVADLYTAHAFDALFRVAVQREGGGPLALDAARQILLIGIHEDAEIVCERLQLAVARAHRSRSGSRAGRG